MFHCGPGTQDACPATRRSRPGSERSRDFPGHTAGRGRTGTRPQLPADTLGHLGHHSACPTEGPGRGCGRCTGRPAASRAVCPPLRESSPSFVLQSPHVGTKKPNGPRRSGGSGRGSAVTSCCAQSPARGVDGPPQSPVLAHFWVLLRVRGAASSKARPGPSARVVDASHHENKVLLRPGHSQLSEALGRFSQKVQISKFTRNMEQERQTPKGRPQLSLCPVHRRPAGARP